MDTVVDGWLEKVSHQPSPNYNQRPAGEQVSLLVIHNISLPPGEFGGGLVVDFFCNRLDCSIHPCFESLRDLKVSAHLLIERDATVTQFVPFNRRAWHAGVSSFSGRQACNDFSIGIELEGVDDQPYTDCQYARLVQVTHALQRQYPLLTVERIVGHCDIAPGRKTDPGPAFDWTRYRNALGDREVQA